MVELITTIELAEEMMTETIAITVIDNKQYRGRGTYHVQKQGKSQDPETARRQGSPEQKYLQFHLIFKTM